MVYSRTVGSRGVERIILGAILVLLIAGGVPAAAQDSDDANSLGDLARQTRAQRASDQGKMGKAQQIADEMQQEHEASDSAPIGFKSYDAGDYRLFVPYPYSLEGRDQEGGAVLLGSQVGVTNTEVVAGNPIPLPGQMDDTDLANFIRQLGTAFSPNTYCGPMKLGTRKAFHCNMNNPHILGKEVVGSMVFIVGSSSVIPVMCVSPDDLNQCLAYRNGSYETCGNSSAIGNSVQRTRNAILTRYDDEKTTYKVCEQIIYPSIQLKEDIVVHPVKIGEKPVIAVVPATPPKAVSFAVAADTSQDSEQGPSLAEMARQKREAAHPKAQVTLDSAEGKGAAPAGFEAFALQYCHNPQQCYQASVVIPEHSEVISSVNGQHIFQTKLNGDRILLFAGPADVNAPYRSQTDPEYIRMRDMANSNGWSREKVDGVSTQELSVEGRPALTTRFRFQRDEKWWVGERTLIEMKTSQYDNSGHQFLVGCMAPEQRFADAEALCTTLLNSLRLE